MGLNEVGIGSRMPAKGAKISVVARVREYATKVGHPRLNDSALANGWTGLVRRSTEARLSPPSKGVKGGGNNG